MAISKDLELERVRVGLMGTINDSLHRRKNAQSFQNKKESSERTLCRLTRLFICLRK